MATRNAVGNTLTGATGSGTFVGSTSPALTTPAIGTPSTGHLTNCDNLPISGGTTGTLPISRGGTQVTSVTTTPTANSFAGWDTNSNLIANNHIAGFATIVTAASTTTLTVSSQKIRYFTGTTTQTVVLPVTSTLLQGHQFTIVNQSTGVVTVQSSGANTIQAMASGTKLDVICILTTGTTAASWDFIYASNATDITGTGLTVRQTSPTLITPILGVATATSINTIPINLGAENDSASLAIGVSSLSNGSLISTNNMALGNSVLTTLATSDGYNLGIGASSLASLTTGSYNLAVGATAMNTSTTSSGCVAIGQAALYSQTTGSTNIGIGSQTGQALASGATALTTGSNNIFIGYTASSNSATSTGVIAIGIGAVGKTATGTTSGDDGACMAIGSSSFPVGFRGNATIYPSAGIGSGTLPLTFSGYWRIVLNGTVYKIPLYPN